MNLKFHTPELVLEEDAIYRLPYYLKKFCIEKPLLLTDAKVIQAVHFSKISELIEQDLKLTIFHQIQSNPTFACAHRASSIYRSNKCDGVVAIGGGSVIDTAKFTAVIALSLIHI